MGDRPIIFSAPMVRALLDGRKTQTRRLIRCAEGADFHRQTGDRHYFGFNEPKHDGQCGVQLPCLPYAVGDRLYVREAFSYDALDCDRDGTLPPWYWADGNPQRGDWSKPKPSIHMPRWASRLTLTVEDVRVERLQAISEADAIAEGARYTDFGKYQHPGKASIDGGRTWHRMKPQQHPGWHMLDVERPTQCLGTPISAFANLWNHLHGEGAWASNPFVVAVTFRVEHGNIDTTKDIQP